MDKIHRARMIIDHVNGLDARWGRAGPPRSETLISHRGSFRMIVDGRLA